MRAADLFQSYRESINPPYSLRDGFTILVTILVLIAIPLTVLGTQTSRDLRGKAETGPTPAAVSIQKKVLLLIYNPIIESAGNKKLVELRGWNNPDQLTAQYIADLKEVSNQLADYQIAERIEVDDIPIKADGFDYTDDTYLQCLNNHSTCHSPDGVNYNLILSNYQVCEKLNSGAIDELWLFGGPWFGYWEANMAGPGAFSTNGPVVTGTTCTRKLHIMGFNFERGVGEMLEDFGHRSEGTLTHVYGGWNVQLSRHDWDRFGHNKGQTPGVSYYQCGTVHYAPNSLSDYDWGRLDYVSSNCDDWYNFPNFQGTTQQINCQAWGCDMRGHHKWWLRHLPQAEGTKDGKLNNWWRYLIDYDNAVDATVSPTVSISNPAAEALVSGTVSITTDVTDNVGVTKVEFYVDGSKKSTATSSPYSWDWDTTQEANGSHTLTAKAYDGAGNIGTSDAISATVNNGGGPQPKPGDLNSDNQVDIYDLSILLSNWGESGGVADIIKDNKVDILDLSALISNWGS